MFLSIIPEYCDDYIVDHSQYSLPLSNLFDPEAMKLSYTDLLLKCEDIFSSISVTNDQATNIELSTRDQSKCKAWFRFRAGRITASKFKAALARTDYTQPSVSLVKRICYPQSLHVALRLQNGGVIMSKKLERHTSTKQY